MFSSIGKKIVMALSGLFLGFFITAHALGNFTTFLGRQSFQNYAEHLHSLGILVNLFEIVLLFVFLVHVVSALILTWENYQARPQSYAVKKDLGGRTLASKSMPYTGVIILIFVGVHLRYFRFSGQDIPVSDLLLHNLGAPAMAVFYLVGLGALALHIIHGFWSLLQTLGLNHPKYNLPLRRLSLAIALAASAIFILIPLCVQFYDNFL